MTQKYTHLVVRSFILFIVHKNAGYHTYNKTDISCIFLSPKLYRSYKVNCKRSLKTLTQVANKRELCYTEYKVMLCVLLFIILLFVGYIYIRNVSIKSDFISFSVIILLNNNDSREKVTNLEIWNKWYSNISWCISFIHSLIFPFISSFFLITVFITSN